MAFKLALLLVVCFVCANIPSSESHSKRWGWGKQYCGGRGEVGPPGSDGRNGTKGEVIDFVDSGTRDTWSIQSVGIAETSNARIVYKNLNSNNIQRQDTLGEFLNRPLFIMKSKLSC